MRGKRSDVAVPVDDYIKYTSETFDIDNAEMADESFSIAAEPLADQYTRGKQFICVHCNTAFQTLRRRAQCPFCHKNPLH